MANAILNFHFDFPHPSLSPKFYQCPLVASLMHLGFNIDLVPASKEIMPNMRRTKNCNGNEKNVRILGESKQKTCCLYSINSDVIVMQEIID